MTWLSRCYDIAGFGIEIAVEDEWQTDAVREEIATYADHLGPADLQVSWRSAPLELGRIAVSGDEGRRQFGRHADGLVVRHNGVSALATESSIILGGTSADADALLDDFQTALGGALTYWLAARQHYAIHAAAIGRDGKALLLLGRPGAGKSTAAWGAHHAGFELLGDDTVFIRRRGPSIEVCGMRKPVAIASEILDRIPAGATQDRFVRPGGGSRNRWAIPPDMLNTNWHEVIGLVTPAHGVIEDGELAEPDTTQLLPLAVGVYSSADDETQLRAWFPHAASIARLPAWELRHSPILERRLETSAHWLGVAFERAEAAAGS